MGFINLPNIMYYREAILADISQLHILRISVKENRLSNPGLITPMDYENYLNQNGKGWVCEENRKILGFSIADTQGKNLWALFVDPAFEGRGIGQQLLQIVLKWYFHQKKENIWLSTAPNTRAEGFYREFGWKEMGKQPNGETRFEMTFRDWAKLIHS